MTIAQNIAHIRAGIERVQRDNGLTDRVRIVAATKMVDPARINALPPAGVTIAAENRVQEFVDKYDKVRGVEWQFIGSLQTNKVKFLVGRVTLIHSVDRESLLDEIERRAGQAGLVQDILIEVNVGGEKAKSGVAPDGLDGLIRYAAALPHVRVKGLMSVLPVHASDLLYKTMQTLYNERKEDCRFTDLSLGMSGDYLTAVRFGANLVRIGSGIFGPRVH